MVFRMRIVISGSKGPVELTVEVMGILPGVHLVDAGKVRGDSVDFYDIYSQITELIQPLITADALHRSDEGVLLNVCQLSLFHQLLCMIST